MIGKSTRFRFWWDLSDTNVTTSSHKFEVQTKWLIKLYYLLNKSLADSFSFIRPHSALTKIAVTFVSVYTASDLYIKFINKSNHIKGSSEFGLVLVICTVHIGESAQLCQINRQMLQYNIVIIVCKWINFRYSLCLFADIYHRVAYTQSESAWR